MSAPFYILLLIIITVIDCVPISVCNRLKIGEHWYDKKVIWANHGKPYNLHIHKSSNTLFFSFSNPETFSETDFQLAYLNIDDGDYLMIAGIKGGCAIAIDEHNDEIYMGGSDGIYMFNMLTKLADFYNEKGKNIWALFFKRNLFYISYPDQKLHIGLNGKFLRVKEFENVEIDNFHISSIDSDIYFANKTGLYKFDNVNTVVESLNELVTVRQIVEDNNGYTYICTNFGVYIDSKYEGLKKILDMKNMYGLAFDKDNNFVYADEKQIIKLTLSAVGCGRNNTHW